MATFHMGLTMAGAISAGAYTAGVVDFLTEALDAWEERKSQLANTPRDQWDVPCHDVLIPVASGASAGGMTGAMALMALAEQPVNAPRVSHNYAQVGAVDVRLPRVFQAWVTRPCLVDVTGGPDLLGTDDLNDGKVRSLLDGTILDTIALQCIGGVATITPRPYLSRTFHLFMTLTSLRGVPYDISFQGAAAGYPMSAHANREHFTVVNAGTGQFTSPWADPDPALVVDFATLPAVPTVASLNALPTPWREYLTAALATGAFPVGLPARIIQPVTVGQTFQRQWPSSYSVAGPNGQTYFRLLPDFPPSIINPPCDVAALAGLSNTEICRHAFAARSVDYVAVDGGVLNNEPFELARWTLMKNPPAANPRLEPGPQLVDRTVVMIDPFPQAPDFDTKGTLDDLLVGVIGKLLPALIDQARFKPDELAVALDPAVASRFLIAPVRRTGPDAPLEDYPLACGLLGGFGGFLDEEFRAHDYQLGRLNCYLFLRDHFVLPKFYTVVADGYAPPHAADRLAPGSSAPAGSLPIIPLIGGDAMKPRPPTWPRAGKADVKVMASRAGKRAAKLFDILKTKRINGPLWRGLATVGWFMGGQSMVEDYVYWYVIKDLILRDQLKETNVGFTADDRKVLSALANPSYDYRTADSIAAEHGICGTAVTAILDKHTQYIVQGQPADGNRPTYTLKERAPSGLSAWRPVQWIKETCWSGAPAIS